MNLFRAWLKYLKNDTSNYIQNMIKMSEMRTAEDIKNRKPEHFETDREQPESFETATFALGCFWGPDALFGGLDGVIRTRVGYAGGDKDNPTYRDLGNHTETIQIDYDPGQISYDDLLKFFWKNHDPQSRQKTQYASKIFYTDEKQKEKAQRSREQQKNGSEIMTTVEPLNTFWVAENYHQKYYLRQNKELERKFQEIYSPEELINSTVAARTNAVIGGKTDEVDLPDEIADIVEERNKGLI
jgi:methionine-S-sulfoxide reductase